MMHLKSFLLVVSLSLASVSLLARDSKYTRHGTGPKYWIAYEWCFENNLPIPEDRWKRNIDWMADTFRDYGYDMICNDGWIEAAQSINENGYITKYNSNWRHGFEYWNKYIEDKGMKVGVYYNPLWITSAAYYSKCKVSGTNGITAADIAGRWRFNDLLFWVDVNKEGAEQWIKGYVRYFKSLGVSYLRIDFLENYERNYGTDAYEKALKWIAEEAGDDLFLSLVMPNCYHHGRTELKYGDMIRVDDDCFKGGWDFASSRRRGQHKSSWPQYGNAFDGMVAFSDVAAKGQMILDGDFMRLNTMATREERQFLYSLMVMGGSALAIADQYDTIGDAVEIYQNREMIELNNLGFVGRPLSQDLSSANSSRWVGQLPDGDYVVGLFNREEDTITSGIDFFKELGIKEGAVENVRDLWQHQDLGEMCGKYTTSLAPHSCKILRIRPKGIIRYQAEFASPKGGVTINMANE
jgi:alpha-glucosidase